MPVFRTEAARLPPTPCSLTPRSCNQMCKSRRAFGDQLENFGKWNNEAGSAEIKLVKLYIQTSALITRCVDYGEHVKAA